MKFPLNVFHKEKILQLPTLNFLLSQLQVAELEKEITEAREKIQFYHAKMQELVRISSLPSPCFALVDGWLNFSAESLFPFLIRKGYRL